MKAAEARARAMAVLRAVATKVMVMAEAKVTEAPQVVATKAMVVAEAQARANRRGDD
jgi:hypothetical protein